MSINLLDDQAGDANGEKFFQCSCRAENVSVMFCIDSFVNVNALNIKDSPCFKCEQGQVIRDDFSNS